MSGLLQSSQEAVRQWRVDILPLDAVSRLQRFKDLLRRVAAANSHASRICICDELVREGAAATLIADAEELSKDRQGRAFELVLQLLEQNEESCHYLGRSPAFEKLVAFATSNLQHVVHRTDPGLWCLTGLQCMNTILAVSSDARGVVCQHRTLLQLLGSLLDLESNISHVFQDITLSTLSQLAMPELDTFEKEDGESKSSSGRCAVCLEDCMSKLESFWSCYTCEQPMHRKCAEEWLSRRHRCPYCRAFQHDGLVGKSAKHMLRPQQLLNFLGLERVKDDLPLAFCASLFLMHLVRKDADAALFEELDNQGFFSHLAQATQAALEQSDWPSGSNCFPLIWKMAITVAQVARCGHAGRVQGALRPIVKFMFQRDGGKHERAWCLRALAACNADAGQTTYVESLLSEEMGDDAEQACIAYELREFLALQKSSLA